MVALSALVTAGVFGLLLPRALREDSAPGRALTLSVLGLPLIVPAFWSGLPMVLGRRRRCSATPDATPRQVPEAASWPR